MKSELSPLQLRFYGFDDVQLESNDEYDEYESYEGPEALACPDVEIHVDEGEGDVWHVTMLIGLDSECDLGVPWKCVPYMLRIAVVGVFAIVGEVEESNCVWLIHMNAPAILYGLARAEIARLTSMGRFGQFVLPAIDLLEMAREVIEDEERNAESPSG